MTSSNGTALPSGAENSPSTALVKLRLGKGDDATPPLDGRGVWSLGADHRGTSRRPPSPETVANSGYDVHK